jgi:penicillin-binding protein 1B
MLTLLAVDVWLLSQNIEERFQGRLWKLPSRVYSDLTLIYPGQSLTTKQLAARLQHLGYRQVTGKPSPKGSYRISGQQMEVHLRDLDTPSSKRPGFRARIRFNHGQVKSLLRLGPDKPLTLLELEPEEIAQFFGPQRESRHLLSLKETPPFLIKAILAAEDADFFDHMGFDFWGILRALWVNLRHGEVRQGGSTITQQLAKSYFLSPEKTISRKVRELMIALILEARYEKNTILEIYLNEIYMGQKGSVSVNGMGEAAWFYFGKPAHDLSLSQAAALAGLIKAPNRYSPFKNLGLCRKRRNQVLKAMNERGWINNRALAKASSTPLGAARFQAYLRKAPYFVDFLSKQLTELYPGEALTSQGLSIYTTLDPMVQRAAQKALSRGLARLERNNPSLAANRADERLQGAVIVMQPKTGNILAMVGGRDYTKTQFNRATQARRQPGSVFKPFVYLASLDSFTPASLLSNRERTHMINGQAWRPHNFDKSQGGRMRMRTALAKSVNLATVDLALRVGLDKVAAVARGFELAAPIKPYPSLALGALEVSPLEIARAYCALAAGGVLPFPLSLREVTNQNSQVLHRRHMKIHAVTTPAKAYLMSSLLRSVVSEGTAKSLARLGIDFPVAGKTGTSNDYRDAWFIGYTPEILALVWVGFDQGRSLHASGAQAALPIWAELIKSIPWQVSGRWFRRPAGVSPALICSDSGYLASRRCLRPRKELFLQGTAPSAICPLHGGHQATPSQRLRVGTSHEPEKDSH